MSDTDPTLQPKTEYATKPKCHCHNCRISEWPSHGNYPCTGFVSQYEGALRISLIISKACVISLLLMSAYSIFIFFNK